MRPAPFFLFLLLPLRAALCARPLSEEVIEPATGEAYLDRTQDFDYKIEKDDLCYALFIEKGFEWGGDWTDRKDFQHFELPTEVTEKYSEMYAK